MTLVSAGSRRRFTEDDLVLAEEFARRAALAIDNARLYSERDHVARALQASLLPPSLPEIPGVDVAARYVAAGEGNEVGGDFYDVFQVGAEAWVVVVGDVSGKGIPAAVVTSFVRYTVRSLAMLHRDPADLLHALDRAIRDEGTEHYCTLAAVRLDRVDGRWELAIALAGHPPALVRRPDRRTYELGTPGTPVGLMSEPEFHTVRHRLGDETVTLYTDGVTEARSPQGLYGEERLGLLVAGLPHDPAAITESIARAVLAWQSDDASDDIAIVTFAAR
jgi:sigma-B regulation protein RsbU (phosphoserine phosphatase)